MAVTVLRPLEKDPFVDCTQRVWPTWNPCSVTAYKPLGKLRVNVVTLLVRDALEIGYPTTIVPFSIDPFAVPYPNRVVDRTAYPVFAAEEARRILTSTAFGEDVSSEDQMAVTDWFGAVGYTYRRRAVLPAAPYSLYLQSIARVELAG